MFSPPIFSTTDNHVHQASAFGKQPAPPEVIGCAGVAWALWSVRVIRNAARERVN